MTWQKVDEVGPCKWNRLSVNGIRLYPLEDSVSLIYKITSHRLLLSLCSPAIIYKFESKFRVTNFAAADQRSFENWLVHMEVCGKSPVVGSGNVIYLSALLGRDGPIPCHKCDWKCENENVCGNMYRCKLTGLNHVCDKNCNQRILYDNHSSLCRASGRIFPLSSAEEHAVKGVRRKLEDESQPSGSCNKRRRRDPQFHSSPFERSFAAVSPICSQAGDGMEMN